MKSTPLIRSVAFAAALGFLGYYGWQNWPDVAAVLGQFGPTNIIFALVFVAASLLCKAWVNTILMRELLHTDLPSGQLLHSYTQSQIVKYIPGKIWGIMFQASTLGDNARKTDVWVVNLYQFLIMNAAVVLVFVATVPFLQQLDVSIRASIVGLVVLTVILFRANFGRLLRLIKVDESTFHKYGRLLSRPVLLRVSALIAIDWFFYLGMWYALALGQMSFATVTVMAINYATASVVGFVVFFLPSGLIAREAAFIAFGRALGDAMTTLLTYSVVIRLLFLLGDFLLVVLTYLFKGQHGRSKKVLG